MASRGLIVTIAGDASKLKRSLGEAEQATGRFGGAMGKMGKVAALAGGVVGVGVVVAGLKSVVGAAEDAELSQRRMETALRNAGVSYNSHAKQIDAVIQSTSKLAALDDEDLQDAFSKIIRTTGDVNKALKDTQLAADVARGANISLEAATRAVQQAEMGRTTALRRLGIDLPKVTEAQDKARASLAEYKASHDKLTPAVQAHFKAEMERAKALDATATKTSALDELQKKFAGSAKSYGESGAAAGERLSVAWENLQETAGKKLIPIIAKLTEALVDVIDWMDTNWPKFQKAFQQAADVVEKAFNKIKPILDGVVEEIKGVVELVTALFQGDWSKAWDGAKKIVEGAVHAWTALIKLELEAVRVAALALGNAALDGLSAGLTAAKNWVKKNWPEIATIISGPFAPIVALATNSFGIRDALEDAFKRLIKAAAGWATDLGSSIKKNTVDALVGIGVQAWGVINNIGEVIAGFANTIAGWGEGIANRIKSAVVSTLVGIGLDAWHVIDNIGSVIGDEARTIKGWGENIIHGIASGVTDAAKELWDAVSGIFDKLPGVVKRILGINSPSTVFMEIGHNIVQGLVHGLHNMEGALLDKAKSMVGGVFGIFGGGGGGGGGTGGAGGVSANLLIGQQMAAARGWTGAQWDALQALWQHESGWSQFARNPDSGAYGIPQALPPSKLPFSGQAGGGSDPSSQIGWGLDYIAGRYGSPSSAWAAWLSRSPHWYAKGGIFTSPSIIGVGEAGPEAVIPLSRGGFGNVTVNINGPVYGASSQQLARELAPTIEAELARRDRNRGGRVYGRPVAT